MILDNKKAKRIIIFLFTFVFIVGILITSLVTKKYNLHEGDIAKFDIKASREVKDVLKTKEKELQAEESVGEQYNKNLEIKKDTLEEINNLFFQVTKSLETELDQNVKIEALKKQFNMNLSEEDIKTLVSLNKEQLALLKKNVIDIMDKVLDYDIREDSEEDIKKAQDAIDVKFNAAKLPKTLRELGKSIGYSQIKPNFFYDEEKTNQLKAEARKMVQPIMIKKDQIVIKEGEPVTARDLIILKD